MSPPASSTSGRRCIEGGARLHEQGEAGGLGLVVVGGIAITVVVDVVTGHLDGTGVDGSAGVVAVGGLTRRAARARVEEAVTVGVGTDRRAVGVDSDAGGLDGANDVDDVDLDPDAIVDVVVTSRVAPKRQALLVWPSRPRTMSEALSSSLTRATRSTVALRSSSRKVRSI